MGLMRKIFLLIAVTGFCQACKKGDSTRFVPYTSLGINDTVWTNNMISFNLTDSLLKTINNTVSFNASFDITKGGKIKLNDSLEIDIPPYSCFNPDDNTLITNGDITVEVTEIRKKGDFIKYLIPTTSTKYLLESAGSFNVRLYKDTHELLLVPNAYILLKWMDISPKTNMNFFNGLPLRNADSLFTWMPSNEGSITVWDSTPFNIAKKGYEMISAQTGWLNCGLIINGTQPGTRLNVTLPLNYTNKNTLVFAVFKDWGTVVRLTPDYNSRSFYSLDIPVNSNVTLLSLSLIDGNLYWSAQDAIIANANRFALSPGKQTAGYVSEFLENL
jgi:hypothetical protein